MNTKTCVKCKKTLLLNNENFPIRKDSKDGFRNNCIECEKEKRKEYYNKNQERIKERVRQYRVENLEEIKIKKKAYSIKNKEKIAEYQKEYREQNKTKMKKYKKEYYKENKAEISKWKKEYRERNKEKIRARKQKYYLENKERIKGYQERWKQNGGQTYRNIYNQHRKALKRNLPSNFTVEDWENCKSYFNYECAYCGEKAKLQQEHFIPLSKGGEYTINNIIPSCETCNIRKRDKNFFNWYPKQKSYCKKREEKILKYLNYTNKNTQQLSIL